MARLALDRVTLSYGVTRVLEDVSLEMADGAFHAMVGPSGSGKTTILKLLAGFVEPDAGRILVDGRDMHGIPPERRELGIVFQNYALFPHMTVGQNVGFGLRMRGVGGVESRKRVATMLDLVGLAGLEGRYPDELSGGQQQRVALARALVIEPKALLLDEPLSALDRKVRQEMQVELKRIQREARVTAVIVTHDQEEALALGDRLVVLDAGSIQQEGAPLEVYNRPRTAFVAGFLGNANMLEAEVTAPESGSVRLTDGAALNGLAIPARVPAGAKVRLSIRPERWRVFDGPHAALPQEGLVVEGPLKRVHQTGETGTGMLATSLGEVTFTVLSPSIGALRPGVTVRLHATAADIHVIVDPHPPAPSA